ncbi:FAD/NAD(P)-binding domain-containing protein [Pluteus cervinus]|uniref:FAD/NAD(P)-binding domain-containing protein n=1 Tax=Pluteus cervinus TaxID=181527 RepID=A0ACD3BHN3_9AGAR|nr:FAD/NAD(P)-binding domain-containing protein [Pluteus cervinus]
MSAQPRRAVVVGAGPVGCLSAIALAKAGWSVSLYEGRADMRLPSSKAAAQQRSINLAISHRGLAALEIVHPGAAQRFLQAAIPMRGRMIHNPKGSLDSQLYDKDGQCINSIDRALLNEGLLEEVSTFSNIRIFFNHKVISANFDLKTLTVHDAMANEDHIVDFDFCVGADGSYSIIRRQMMRVVRMNYSQEYIRDEYVELKMPAGRGDNGQPTFLLDPNHLHIWPRHSFMLIALPNKDKSFTCTLFAPSVELDRLDSAGAILAWFKSHFPDALEIIGEKDLLNDFTRNPRSPLICTKAMPYHYKDRVILLGDAAHSMVPFYGQGLNCGLEDVRVLSALFLQEGIEALSLGRSDAVDEHLASALNHYSENRHEDLVAISNLAMNNYVEMRHSVVTLSYLFKKTLDNILYSLTSRQISPLASLVPILSRIPFPPGVSGAWLPLYTMVTFRPDISYATAQKKAERQAKILTGLGWASVTAVGLTGAWLTRIAWSVLV